MKQGSLSIARRLVIIKSPFISLALIIAGDSRCFNYVNSAYKDINVTISCRGFGQEWKIDYSYSRNKSVCFYCCEFSLFLGKDKIFI